MRQHKIVVDGRAEFHRVAADRTARLIALGVRESDARRDEGEARVRGVAVRWVPCGMEMFRDPGSTPRRGMVPGTVPHSVEFVTCGGDDDPAPRTVTGAFWAHAPKGVWLVVSGEFVNVRQWTRADVAVKAGRYAAGTWVEVRESHRL